MFYSIRRYQTAGWTEDVTRKIEAGFVPLMRQSPGFRGYHIIDVGEGVMASISIFDTAEQVDAANANAAEWVKENLAGIVTAPPEITAGLSVLSVSED